MSKKAGVVGAIKQHFEDYLSEFVYGGIDGVITTFAVVAGATGARFDTTVILVLGFANLIADGLSMGVGSYLSTKSEQELMVKRGESADDEPSPVINGATTYVSFILFGLIPLLIYAIDAILGLELNNLFTWAIALTTLAFVVIGVLKSKVAQSNVGKAILETLVLGFIAAAFAYFAGDFLEQLINK